MKPKIAFIMDQIGFLEKFSIPIIAATTRSAGYKTLVTEFYPTPNSAISLLKKFRPDIIGFSVASIESQRYLEINRILKKSLRYFSVFGGPHPTFFPEMVREDGVDAVCKGEGDVVLPQLLERFGKPSMYHTPNFLFKKKKKIIENPLVKHVDNLDTLPFPDRESLYTHNPNLAAFPMKSFFAGRGCPFHCSYCFNHIYNRMYHGLGRIIRTKSVGYLIREINEVRRNYPMSFIKFHDDIFGLDTKWLEEFAERFPKEVGLPFLSYSRANIITDNYCRLLKKAGCRSTSLAFEAGDEKLRNKILHRNMMDKQIIKGCRLLKKHNIGIYSLNMVGLPGETETQMMKTVRLNRKTRVDYADASIFQPYPGTDLTKYSIEAGLLDANLSHYESQFSASVLRYPEEFRDKIYVIHRMFPILVDHPKSEKLLPILFRFRSNKTVKSLLNLLYRFYYGYFLHVRVYGFHIPPMLRLRLALPVLFSKNRA